MSVAKDLTGEKFGEWTILSRAENTKSGVMWNCRCSCGIERKVSNSNLKSGGSLSCGCLKIINNDLTGKVFNRWTVLKKVGKNTSNNTTYLCRCECGNEKVVSGSNLVNGKSKGCHRCAVTGKDHYLWNPNLSDKDRELNNNRKYPEYIEWRKEVFNRDSYTCQLCGAKDSGTLNAHHIESYTANPELRTALSNGITLCEECHKNFHHQYGYGNNTKAQLNEFSKVCN